MLDLPSCNRNKASSNAGRFSLLGKETRWACHNNSSLSSVLRAAVLLQHVTVPEDIENIGRFVPE
jgi:hypothetical protein